MAPFTISESATFIVTRPPPLHPPDGWWELARLLGPLVWIGSTVTDSTLASYLFTLNLAALVVTLIVPFGVAAADSA